MISGEKTLTIIGKHQIEARTKQVNRRDLEYKEDDSVLVDPGGLYFQDGTTIGVDYKDQIIAGIYINPRTVLPEMDPKLTAAKIVRATPGIRYNRYLKVETLSSTMRGQEIGELLKATEFDSEIECKVALPRGNSEFTPEGESLEILALESNPDEMSLDLVIPNVVGKEGIVKVKGDLIISSPESCDAKFKGKITVKGGLVVIDGVIEDDVIKSVISSIDQNNLEQRTTVGMAVLSPQMSEDAVYSFLENGFTIVADVETLIQHANQLGSYNLEPWINREANYPDILLAANVLSDLNPNKAPIYIQLRTAIGLCISERGKIFLNRSKKGQAYQRGVSPGYLGGLIDSIHTDKFKGVIGTSRIMCYTAAFAKTEQSQRFDKTRVWANYEKELRPFSFATSLVDYVRIIRTSRESRESIQAEFNKV
ncbi:hypothetical protein ACFL2V_19730 [Pseudomonadota bacterium]